MTVSSPSKARSFSSFNSSRAPLLYIIKSRTKVSVRSLSISLPIFLSFSEQEPFTLDGIIMSGIEESPLKSILPRPEDFSKALYIIDMGQNDLANPELSLDYARDITIPKIIWTFSRLITVSSTFPQRHLPLTGEITSSYYLVFVLSD